jgi:hypothetical protein
MTAQEQNALKSLEKILKKYRIVLRDAADTIRTQDISKYPIFVAAKQEIEVGIPLLQKGQMADDWFINASTLEEFHAKQIISVDRVDEFRDLYRKNINEICIAAIIESGAKFLFIP